MTDDLIARLRSENATLGDDINGYEPPRIQLEAADALEAKDSEIRILRSMIRGDALQTDRLLAVNEAFDAEIEAQARRIAELEMQVAFIKPVELAQNARIAELEAALKPFDEMLQRDFSIMADDKRYADDFTSTVLMRLGDLRTARAAYRGENG